jgi:protein-disulfide isomerase
VPTLEQVLEKNPDKVKVVFKNFPLSSHKFAEKAASAALAAKSQGKFWDFHDLLFENHKKLNDQKIKDIAKQLGLDKTAFEEARKDPQLGIRIRRDFTDGVSAGVRGTPTIFINGRQLKNRSLNGFQTAINRELKKLDDAK